VIDGPGAAAMAAGEGDGAMALHVDAPIRRGAAILALVRDLDGGRPVACN